MAYDTVRRRVVVFGGSDADGELLSDTWEWDGVTWAQHSPNHHPSGRRFLGMVYDEVRRRVVLFGGYGPGDQPLADTWELDGNDWTLLTLDDSPSGRGGHAMAYDASRKQTVLFGGGDDQTWEFDGSRWQRRAARVSPDQRWFPTMAYDLARRRVVLFGGWDRKGEPRTDTLEWDGASWNLRMPFHRPSEAYQAAADADPDHDRSLRFVMAFSLSAARFADVVGQVAGPLFEPRRPAVLVGNQPRLGNPAFHVDALAGAPWLLGVIELRASTHDDGFRDSVASACGPILTAWGVVTDRVGFARGPALAIPPAICLLGVPLYARLSVADSSVPRFGVRCSPRRQFVLGR
jgi:hypothetical protein